MTVMAASEAYGAVRPTEADRTFQNWFWTVQRALWLVLALFVAAGLAGLTGSGGPLARGVAAAGAVRIDYPAITRWQTADTMQITLPAAASAAEVELPASLLDRFTITTVDPLPASVTATARGHRYAFALERSGTPVTIHFGIRASAPDVLGTSHRVKVAGIPASIRVTVLP
jgi:hypothetical protein